MIINQDILIKNTILKIMESKKEEEKKIDPSLDLAKAFEELGLDPKAEDFTQEKMVARF